MYDIDLDYGVEVTPESPGSSESEPSVYSQPSFEEGQEDAGGQEITFDLDYSLMLPLSLPTTPMDLEADIALGLEKLRTVQEETSFDIPDLALEEQQPSPQPQPQQEVVDDVFSPVSSSFSFSPPPSATAYFTDYASQVPLPTVVKRALFNEEKILKSKWSSSTLGSVREEHEQQAPASKLRLYFGGQSPSKSGKRSSQSSKKVPPTPTSPFSLMTPRKASRGYTTPPPSASPSARGHGYAHSRGSSDVMIIGYGGGIRRRGSVSTVSDVGSEDSSSSTSSSGLRRKPIPVEMFLRSVA